MWVCGDHWCVSPRSLCFKHYRGLWKKLKTHINHGSSKASAIFFMLSERKWQKNLRERWPRFTCLSGQELYKKTIPHIYQFNSCLQVDKIDIRQIVISLIFWQICLKWHTLDWDEDSSLIHGLKKQFYSTFVGRITKKDKDLLHITCVLLFISFLKSHISILWGIDHIIMHYYCLKIIPSSATLMSFRLAHI